MPYIPGVISDQTRVLHAALQLTTFTLRELAELAGLERSVAQAVVERSRDMIEEVSGHAPQSRATPPTEAQEAHEGVGFGGEIAAGTAARRLYRLRESARPRLTREAVDLADRLRSAPRASSQETARTAMIALDAAESSAELRKLADGDSRAWGERAVTQLDLARRLVVLV